MTTSRWSRPGSGPWVLRAAALLLTLLPGGALLPSAEASAAAPSRPAPGLWLGPVAGLTSEWHPAPATTGVPVGTTIRLGVSLSPGEVVAWTGAEPRLADPEWSVAELEVEAPGVFSVEAEARVPGLPARRYSLVLHALPLAAHEVRLSPVAFSVEPALPAAGASFETILRAFRQPSIAGLVRVSEGRYRTSVQRRVRLAVTVDPPQLAPLVEWRLGSGTALVRPTRLGTEVEVAYSATGFHPIWVGPLARPRHVALDTYRVEIEGPLTVVDGVPLTYRARTEPPGHEAEVTWLASTLYGTVEPETGSGPVFTPLFRRSDSLLPRSTIESGRWLGVRADNALFEEDTKGAGGTILRLDPDFGFDPTREFPPRLPGPVFPPPGPVCEPDLVGIVGDPPVDRNGDGHPDIVSLRLDPAALVPTPGAPVCFDRTRYCFERDGEFIPVQIGSGTALLHPQVPVPLAAISEGCPGFEAPPICPELASGERAVCDSVPALGADCLSITICPEDGDWEDLENPAVGSVFVAENAEQPDPGLEVAAEDLLDPARSVFINPCEWDRITNNRLEVSLADQPEDRYMVNLERGSDRWKIGLRAGIEQLRAWADRPVFHPSVGYGLTSVASFDLDATTPWKTYSNVLRLRGETFSGNCRDASEVSLRIFGDEVQREAATSSSFEQGVECVAALADLRAVERQVNEALQSALAVWAFHNLVGDAGPEYPGRADAEAFVAAYRELATTAYPEALRTARQRAREALSSPASSALTPVNIMRASPSVGPRVSIGPFTASLEFAVVGSLAAELEVEAETDFDPPDCPGARCRNPAIGVSMVPRADIGGYAFLSAGISLGRFAGVEGGIRGTLDLADLQLPAEARIGLLESVEERSAVLVVPEQAMELVDRMPDRALGEEALLPGGELPSVASFTAPYNYGARLDGEFLSGRLELVVRAWVLFWDTEWKKSLASWNGFHRTWHIGEPVSGSADIASFADATPMGELPGMITLPDLRLVGPDEPPADPLLAAQLVQALIIDKLGRGMYGTTRFSHDVQNLGEPGEPWDSEERCSGPVG